MLLPTYSAADSLATRRMADSEFDIAEKAYRRAIKNYGENLQGLPAEEKMSACKKMGWALHDNNIQYEMADPFTQIKYKRQMGKLRKYNEAFGCTQ